LLYYIPRDLDVTLDYAFKALEIYKEINNEAEIAGCFHNISLVYSEQGEKIKALDYLKKSIEIHKRNNSTFSLILAQRALGDMYFSMDSLEKAKHYFIETIKLVNKSGLLNRIEIDNLMSLGQIAENQSNTPKALSHYQNALRKGFYIEERYIWKSCLKIAKLNIKMDKLPLAYKYLQKTEQYMEIYKKRVLVCMLPGMQKFIVVITCIGWLKGILKKHYNIMLKKMLHVIVLWT